MGPKLAGQLGLGPGGILRRFSAPGVVETMIAAAREARDDDLRPAPKKKVARPRKVKGKRRGPKCDWVGEPWVALGMSKRTWHRKRQRGEL